MRRPSLNKEIHEYIKKRIADQEIQKSSIQPHLAIEPQSEFLDEIVKCKQINIAVGEIFFHGGRLGEWANVEELHHNISHMWVSKDRDTAMSYANDKKTMPGSPFLLKFELQTNAIGIIDSQQRLFKFAKLTTDSGDMFAPMVFPKIFSQYAIKSIDTKPLVFINVQENIEFSMKDVLVPLPGKLLKLKNITMLTLEKSE